MLSVARVADRISRVVDRLTVFCLVPVVVGFFAVVFVAVVSRYVLNTSIVESIELTRLCFNWSCFLAAAVAVRRSQHVRVTFLVARLPRRAQTVISALVDAIMSAFFVMMIVEGWDLYQRLSHTVFPALGWSQGLLYLSLPVSGCLMLVHSLAGFIATVAGYAPVAAPDADVAPSAVDPVVRP